MIKKVYLLASLYIRKFKKNRDLFFGLLHTEKKRREGRKVLLSKITETSYGKQN